MKSLFRIAIWTAWAFMAGCVFAQGTSTTSTSINPQGLEKVIFYYAPNNGPLIWEASIVCGAVPNQGNGPLYVTFIQPGEPNTNLTFQNSCNLTGSGHGPYNETTTTPLTFLDADSEQEVITSLSWTTTCVPVLRSCKWTSPSNNGMSVNYQQ